MVGIFTGLDDTFAAIRDAEKAINKGVSGVSEHSII